MKSNARTPQQQAAVIDALQTKCAILWTQLDALYFAYVAPRMPPPGAFRPDDLAAPDPLPMARPDMAHPDMAHPAPAPAGS